LFLAAELDPAKKISRGVKLFGSAVVVVESERLISVRPSPH